ncbi:MAG: hypothetical protein R3C26_14420 [Calditrichia bacterium]
MATESGVYKSIDDGENWFIVPPIRDKVSGEGIYNNTFYAVATSPAMAPEHRFGRDRPTDWPNTDNSGFDWTIYRSFVSTRERTDPKVKSSQPVYASAHRSPLPFPV